MPNAMLDESQAGIKMMGEIPTSDMQMILTIIAEREELKSLLMREKEESEKAGLKFNIQKMKIMPSSPITFMANIRGKSRNSDRIALLRLQNHCKW